MNSPDSAASGPPACPRAADVSALLCLRRAGRIALILCGGYALAGGLITLLGWSLGITRLTDWNSDGITMKANTALCAAAAGLALLLRRLWPRGVAAARILAALVLITGVLVLLQHITGADFGIDTLLYNEPPGARATAAPGRMGPPAAVSFVLIGIALFLSTGGPSARRWAARPGLMVLLIALLSLLGFLYGADQLYTIPRLSGIAFQTSTILVALGAGLVLLTPGHGLTAALLRPDAGGMALRRLLLPIVLVPAIVGHIGIHGQQAGLYDTAFGAAIFAMAMVVTLGALLWWTAGAVSRSSAAADREHRRATEVLNSIHDGFLVIDAAGRFTEFNAAARRIFAAHGLNADALTGRLARDVFPDALDVPAAQAFARTRESRTATETEDCYDRWQQWFSVRHFPTADGGVATFFTDITARKQADEELKNAHRLLGDRAAHLESLVEERTGELRDIIGELEAFSYSMAHDLRGPLRALQGYANILKADYGAQMDETGRGYLTRIGTAAERMHRLVSDVLHYSAVSLESLPLAPVSLPPLIQDIMEQYPSLHTAEIRVAKDFPQVVGNGAALTQVLSNLLTNAAKFVAPGKSATIDVSARRDGEWIVVIVQDDGIGIPHADQERIFRMFERVHGETEYEGTGIGLAIARRAAERMGGRLDVESVPGHGSRFLLRLRPPE